MNTATLTPPTLLAARVERATAMLGRCWPGGRFTATVDPGTAVATITVPADGPAGWRLLPILDAFLCDTPHRHYPADCLLGYRLERAA